MEAREIEFFKKQMESNLHKASMGTVTLTNFLDATKLAHLEKLKEPFAEIVTDGGFENDEHQRAIFKPEGLAIQTFKIKIYEIIYPKRYLELTHRKVLGSLMGLGIKRDSIGDIWMDGTSVYFACTEEIASYIIASYKTISGIPIELKEVQERLTIERELREENHIVSSMRLDVILASAYKLSRAEALERIAEGAVSLNHMVCLNSSKLVAEDDIISVRHKGRIYVGRIGGKTKSGRLNVKLGFLS